MTATSTLDVNTTTAIRDALSAAGRGQIAEACQVGERALAAGGDIVALNAMLGMLHSRSGSFDRAASHLRAAHQERPRDPIIANNLINALVQVDQKREALDILTDELIAADASGQLLKVRGFLAQMVDEFDLAITSYEQVLARDPADCESWNNLGNARCGAGDFDGSVEALQHAAKLAPSSAPIRLNLANALNRAGNWDESEAELRRISDEFPDDPNPLRELHALLKESGRDKEALTAIEDAIARAPEDVPLLLGLASHLSRMINSTDAEKIYRRVLALEPANGLGNLGLAVCFEVTNQTEKLSELVVQAQERGVASNALNFIRAFSYRRAKRFADGLAAMEQVPADMESARRAHLTGQLLEGVGRYEEAFESYTKMNELMSEDGPRPQQRAAGYRNMLRRRHEAMTEEWVSRWRPETVKDPRPAPVFLFGFPRSGTTLLDTMLMGHPQIEVLEEEPTLHKAFELLQDYENMPTATDPNFEP